jgi:hypothetical protein
MAVVMSFFALQLVFHKVFSLYWTFQPAVFAVSTINRRGIKISVEWKWFDWNWKKIDWVMAVGMSYFSVTTCFSKRFFRFWTFLTAVWNETKHQVDVWVGFVVSVSDDNFDGIPVVRAVVVSIYAMVGTLRCFSS